ncbi:MAG: hypothetical protein KKF48_04235 [Nanoarchaeota archaeon]|nr:hypothetical protein [Nanoarchaeota archaeon]MBU1028227.1 hypothetical protein [Nanoarchaeota archaeon]
MVEELLYTGDFNYVIDHENDGNGHLKCSNYFDYTEIARHDWLDIFGWSDEEFNERGVAQNRIRWENPAPEHCLPVSKGDNIKVNIGVVLQGSRKFNMIFRYYNSKDKLVFNTGSTNCFGGVNSSNTGKLTNIIRIPDFFLKKLRASRDKG